MMSFCFRSELSEHVDSIDSSLENLQSILNSQTFTFDTSPLTEVSLTLSFDHLSHMLTASVCINVNCLCVQFFSSSCPSGDFDLDSLDTVSSTTHTVVVLCICALPVLNSQAEQVISSSVTVCPGTGVYEGTCRFKYTLLQVVRYLFTVVFPGAW